MLKQTSALALGVLLTACGSSTGGGGGGGGDDLTHPDGIIDEIVPLNGGPYDVAVTATGVTYVTLIGTNYMVRGTLQSRTFPDTVVVGSTPPHVRVNPSGTRAFCTLQTGRGVAAVNVATNTLLGVVPFDSDGFNLAVSPSGARVYATTASGWLHVIEAANGNKVDSVFVGAAANGLAFAPNGGTLYVSSRDAGTVAAVNTTTNEITRTYGVGGMPQRLAVSRDGNELYVANEVSGLNIVNVASGNVTSVSVGGDGYGLGLTPDGEQLYVTVASQGLVRIFDRQSRTLLNTLLTGGEPRNVTFAEKGALALITTEAAVAFVR